MKKFVVLVLSLLIGVCALGLTACGHEHSYTDSVTEPTCTDKGYTTHTCECGDVVIDTYIDELGHAFTNYVSDDNATYDEDGTKTAVCDRIGCSETNTVTETGTKLESYMTFNTLTFDGLNANEVVSNKTDEFDFNQEITIHGNVEYVVALVKFGSNQVLTKIVPLGLGDNNFYIFELKDKKIIRTFNITIRRRPMYTVIFNTNGGTSIQNQIIEER